MTRCTTWKIWIFNFASKKMNFQKENNEQKWKTEKFICSFFSFFSFRKSGQHRKCIFFISQIWSTSKVHFLCRKSGHNQKFIFILKSGNHQKSSSFYFANLVIIKSSFFILCSKLSVFAFVSILRHMWKFIFKKILMFKQPLFKIRDFQTTIFQNTRLTNNQFSNESKKKEGEKAEQNEKTVF